MMATVPHVTSALGLRKFQADGFLLTRVYNLPQFLVYILLRLLCVSTSNSLLYSSADSIIRKINDGKIYGNVLWCNDIDCLGEQRFENIQVPT